MKIPKIILRRIVLPILSYYDRQTSSIKLSKTLIAVGIIIAAALLSTTRGTINVTGKRMISSYIL